ncbi:MAG: DUF4143 domain-containing protein [Spirochaetales bacterium]|nr:DUF4143 domain-containing protein [Spirochaetales bacterium]
MSEKKYYKRIADKILDLKLRAFGATNIVGPKWCGKTETALQRSKSKIMLQKDPDKDALIYTAKVNPMALLAGEQPRLIDEWQDAPSLWDAVRSYCDENHGHGHFILTGSTSNLSETYHTGTGRISTMKMYPMSLYESLESNGSVSLLALFDKTENLEKGCKSDLTIDNLVFAACRGGWPESVLMDDKEAQLAIPKDYFQQIYSRDMFNVDKVKRNPQTMKALLRSYARNISTLAKKVSILEDVNATNPITDVTLDDYISVLEKLFIVEDVYGWCPSIRSKTAIRSGRKREFVDPSIAVVAQGGSPSIYNLDLKSFGFIFETLCIRDLKIYSQAFDGEVSYYHDNLGLEADCVLHLNDGRYALIEFKLGSVEIEEGAKNLNQMEKLIKEHNEESSAKIRVPDLKIVITGSQYGYKRDDGVFVVPIGCLKD